MGLRFGVRKARREGKILLRTTSDFSQWFADRSSSFVVEGTRSYTYSHRNVKKNSIKVRRQDLHILFALYFFL